MPPVTADDAAALADADARRAPPPAWPLANAVTSDPNASREPASKYDAVVRILLLWSCLRCSVPVCLCAVQERAHAAEGGPDVGLNAGFSVVVFLSPCALGGAGTQLNFPEQAEKAHQPSSCGATRNDIRRETDMLYLFLRV